MKIPYDFKLHPISLRPYIEGVDLSHMGHGPRRKLKLWEVKFLRTGVNGHLEKYPRLWVYTYFGAFFIDWQWM